MRIDVSASAYHTRYLETLRLPTVYPLFLKNFISLLPACFTIQSNLYACSFSFQVKVKVKFTLEQATKTQRASRGIALLFL